MRSFPKTASAAAAVVLAMTAPVHRPATFHVHDAGCPIPLPLHGGRPIGTAGVAPHACTAWPPRSPATARS